MHGLKPSEVACVLPSCPQIDARIDAAASTGKGSPPALTAAGKHRSISASRTAATFSPMPWFSMKDLTDADLKAIWVYLKSFPPVKNPVPLPVLPQASPAASAPK